jgi:tetratricopeptide (TPR) repeat protein
MDRNLEKTLRKIQALRAAGQQDRALKQLQDLARKHPDTPHYQYEAAMVAFDLGDYGVGLTALKGLLRAAPDTREKVLKACCDRFNAQPTLPLAEFLVEQLLADRKLQEALSVAQALAPPELEVYRKKASVRQRSLSTSPDTPKDLLRAGHLTQLVIARAAREPQALAESIEALLALDPTLAPVLGEICAAALTDHQREPRLLLVHGRCLLQSGRVASGTEKLVEACSLQPAEAPGALALASAQQPSADQRAVWLRCVGDLALLARDGKVAAASFREAADVDPTLRTTLLSRLEAAPEPDSKEGLAELLKLRLRLMVVQRHYGSIPALTERILSEGLAPPEELRGLMGEGSAGPAGPAGPQKRPAELVMILAEAALAATDLRAVANYLAEIPDTDDHSLHRLLRSLEKALPQWPQDDRLELLALLAIVQARVGDREESNKTLVGMWGDRSDKLDVLFAITERCLERVHPTPTLLTCFLPHALRQGKESLVARALDSVLRHTPENVKWLVTDLIEYIDGHPQHAGNLLKLLDECDKDLGAAQHLRYPVACAALLAQRFERAIPEFQILLMARPQLASEVLERVRKALRENPGDLHLNLSAYELLAEEKAWGEAAQCLEQALKADPTRIEELSQRFDQLLERDPQSLELWRCYADALFAVGRFGQVAAVCERASGHLQPDEQGDFRLLRARMMVEDGHLSEALDVVAELLESGAVTPARSADVVRAVVAADPTSGRAQLLLGVASAEDGLLDAAIEALVAAARADRTLVGAVTQKLEELAARPAAQPAHLVQLAGFYRWKGATKEAARAYEQALRLDREMSERVLLELSRELDDPHGDLALTMVGARAARMAGRAEQACTLLTQVYSRDTGRFESVLAELRKTADDFQGEMLAPRTMARVLLAHRSQSAAAEVIMALAENTRYPLQARLETLQEFHKRLSGHAGLAISLAQLWSAGGNVEEAVELLWLAVDGEELDAPRAARVCRSLLQSAPEHGELRLILHDLLLRQGQIDEAMAALPEAEALSAERNAELSRRFATHRPRVLSKPVLAARWVASLRRQGKQDEALTTLRTAAEAAPQAEAVPLWIDLARLLQESGRADESRAIIERLVGSGHDRGALYQTLESWSSQRLDHEIGAVRARLQRQPQSMDAALDLADLLLRQGRADEAEQTLRAGAAEGEQRLRRACLLARAFVDCGHAAFAEAVLRPLAGVADTGSLWAEEIQFRLADCADRLERHGEAHARFVALIDSPRFGLRARQRAKEAYARYLDDAAGAYRAVLSKVTTL